MLQAHSSICLVFMWISSFRAKMAMFYFLMLKSCSRKKYFEKKNMFLNIKPTGQKANLAEGAIRSLKRTLYHILRSKKSKNWTKYLPTATKIINSHFNPGNQCKLLVYKYSVLTLTIIFKVLGDCNP